MKKNEEQNITNMSHHKFIIDESGTLLEVENNKELSSVIIPDSVTSIGAVAFGGCESIESITIPNGVTYINDYTFSGCSSLKSVSIPNSVYSIADCAFQGCNSLRSLIIPNSVTEIAKYAFDYCDNLTVYTDNQYVIEYCNDYGIPVKSASEFVNESIRKPFRKLKLRIEEK